MMDFDDLLKAQRTRATEMPASGTFAQDVLREIRLRNSVHAKEQRGWWGFLEGIWRPPFLAAGLATALAVGAMAPLLVRPISAPPVSIVTDMDIFTGNSRHIPSGLLATLP